MIEVRPRIIFSGKRPTKQVRWKRHESPPGERPRIDLRRSHNVASGQTRRVQHPTRTNGCDVRAASQDEPHRHALSPLRTIAWLRQALGCEELGQPYASARYAIVATAEGPGNDAPSSLLNLGFASDDAALSTLRGEVELALAKSGKNYLGARLERS